MPTQQLDVRKFYYHFGVELQQGDELIGDCPLCDKENHLYVNSQTGLFSCKSCGEEGNLVLFMRAFHKVCLDDTTDEDYKSLSADRGIASGVLRDHGLALNWLTGDWLVPIYNSSNVIVNLYQYDMSTRKMMCSPGHPQGLYMLNTLRRDVSKTYICEGHWDALCLYQVLDSVQHPDAKNRTGNTLRDEYDILAVPGASIFKDSWTKIVKDRDVMLAYDNDTAGTHGMDRMERVLQKATDKPRSVQRIKWPSDAPQNDIRDLGQSMSARQISDYLLDNMESVDLEAAKLAQQPLPCGTFNDLVNEFGKVLVVNQQCKDLLALCSATLLSTHIPGESLWFKVVGPPGSGKTTFVDPFANVRSMAYKRDHLTGLVSGKMDKSDPSPIRKMKGKTFIVLDADTIMGSESCNKLMREMRRVYDKSYSTDYLTGWGAEYEDLNLSVIWCGTKRLRYMDDPALGDRFLTKELRIPQKQEDNVIRRAIRNSTRRMEGLPGYDMTGVKRATLGFLMDRKEENTPQLIDDDVEEAIRAMSKLVGYSRSNTTRDKTGRILYATREACTRIAGQLVKCANCLGLVFDVQSMTDEIMRILGSIAMDTSESPRYNVLRYLYSHDGEHSIDNIAHDLFMSPAAVRKILEDAIELKLVCYKRVCSEYCYKLTSTMDRIFDDARKVLNRI
jgi:hypothetical protein